MLTFTPRLVFAAALALSLPVGLIADTLIMRDGTRVRGELIVYRNGTIELEERGGFVGGRTIRLNREDVVRIELDETTTGGSYPGGSGAFPGGGRPGGMRERQ